jgi:hypothetical protein
MGTRKADRIRRARVPALLSGGVSRSGTVVPQSKTLRAQGGRALYRRPSFTSPVPACCFDIHALIMAQAGADRKPSIGFQARFFWEELNRRLWLTHNGLRREKSPKTGKRRKKVQNNCPETPVFLQKLGAFSNEGVRNNRCDIGIIRLVGDGIGCAIIEGVNVYTRHGTLFRHCERCGTNGAFPEDVRFMPGGCRELGPPWQAGEARAGFRKTRGVCAFLLVEAAVALGILGIFIAACLSAIVTNQVCDRKAKEEAIAMDFLTKYVENIKALPFASVAPGLPINWIYNGVGGAPLIAIPANSSWVSLNTTAFQTFYPDLLWLSNRNPMMQVALTQHSVNGALNGTLHDIEINVKIDWDAPLAKGGRLEVEVDFLRTVDVPTL